MKDENSHWRKLGWLQCARTIFYLPAATSCLCGPVPSAVIPPAGKPLEGFTGPSGVCAIAHQRQGCKVSFHNAGPASWSQGTPGLHGGVLHVLQHLYVFLKTKSWNGSRSWWLEIKSRDISLTHWRKSPLCLCGCYCKFIIHLQIKSSLTACGSKGTLFIPLG